MTTVQNTGRELVIDGNQIPLPAEIESVIQLRNTIVVLLDPDGEVPSKQNIWGFDGDGTLLWKVEEVRAPSGDTSCYVDIWNEDTDLWAADWKGMDYLIDPETGKHSSKEFRK